MEQKTSENIKLLLALNTIRRIIDIFLGPFLTAYLFKIAINNIQIISIYNIFLYIVVALVSLIIGRILKNKYEMLIFRIGMISKFILLVILIMLGNHIVDYIWLLAIVSGISTETWSFPLNLFSTTLVSNNEKKTFVVHKNMLNNIAKILVPFLLGSIITIKSFEITAVIVLVLSGIQILLSFKLDYLKKDNIEKKKLNLIKEIKRINTNIQLKRFFRMKFLKGMAYEGALDTSVTLLIIIAFKSDFSYSISIINNNRDGKFNWIYE